MRHHQDPSQSPRLPRLAITDSEVHSAYTHESQSYAEKTHAEHTQYADTFAPNDLDDALLRAVEPPDHSCLSLDETLRNIKLAARKKRCFQQMLDRVEMSFRTLHFKPEYERSYCAYLYEHAVPRIRYAMGIAFVFLLIKATYEALNVSPVSLLKSEWKLVFQLHVFLALPVLAAMLTCTYFRELDSYCEIYAAIPFLVVTMVLTAQKILLETSGPIFSMFLVFVPVFSVVRLRFMTSLTLVALMFGSHIASLLLFHHVETRTDVFFQAYNYFGGIAVGALNNYRAEIMRRRNYAMLLPFYDGPLDGEYMHNKLHDPRLKKHTIMSRTTLKFKNDTIDEVFYRHWYLIDSCPFEHPNAGALHRNVYRSIRFAVGGVIFSQLMLMVQDWQYLYSDATFPHAAYVVATCLRFAIVIPAYSLSPLVLLFCGTRFYRLWRAQASNEDRGSACSPSARSARNSRSMRSVESSNVSTSSVHDEHAYVAMRSPTSYAQDSMAPEDPHDAHTPFRQNYVRVVQCLSTAIVFCHALAMGIILLLVDRLANQFNASVAPCYFVGCLNALLFPHRGFRLRFVYATAGTLCVSVILIAAATATQSPKLPTYTSYIALTNTLGMMISHEEESLRRIFFVRMMLRTDEFKQRHDAILTLEPWFKEIIRWRRRQAKNAGESQQQSPAAGAAIVQIPTVTHMAQANRIGMNFELTRMAIALLTEIV